MRSIRSLRGPALCAAAAFVFAAPTLFLPADSPTGAKAGFLIAGTVVLVLGAIDIRRDGTTRANARRSDAPSATEE
ncbi:hypothetical protein [Microbacterium trichothecenolyticum]|uniref:Uncharacterized protein n=1 Tax=Microbacterium trichothecenolyticum TaxID=69370 RepID=A0ABU0TUB1_MICTR|nr:hypothetical protein [Microbacterium trichothecenolyticum]MDQ1123256.1 hypothetical protein [Microbacterium trichothecenolyticum]